MTGLPSDFLEVGSFPHGQGLQESAKAVERHLDRAQANPLAAADDAAAPRRGVAQCGDGQADGAAKLDAVGALVEIDQHGQRVGGAGVLPRRTRDGFGRLACDLAGGGVEADGGADLAEVAGKDPAAEHLLGARQVGEARSDLAAREHLDDRQRRLSPGQLREHHALERLVVLGQDEVAQPLADLLLDRSQLLPHVVHVAAARGQLGLQLRVVGAEAELHAAVGHERLDTGEQRVDVGLAEAVGVEALELDRRLQPTLGEQPRDDLLLQHALELAGDAGREEEARAADVDGEAAGGADGVVDDLGCRRQHRLLAVVRRHRAATAPEEILHLRQPLLVERQLDAGRLSGDLLREVVDGGAETTVDDDGVGALARQLKGTQEALAVVAHRRLPGDREADVLDLLADVREVGVDDLAGEDLVAGTDDLDAHGYRRTFSSASATACGFSRGMKWPQPGTTRSSVPAGKSARSLPLRSRLTASSPPCRMSVGTVIGGRAASRPPVASRRGAPGAVPWAWAEGWGSAG